MLGKTNQAHVEYAIGEGKEVINITQSHSRSPTKSPSSQLTKDRKSTQPVHMDSNERIGELSSGLHSMHNKFSYVKQGTNNASSSQVSIDTRQRPSASHKSFRVKLRKKSPSKQSESKQTSSLNSRNKQYA